MKTIIQEIESLSVPERLQLVEDLWDSIVRNEVELPVPQWQRDELARRKKNYLQSTNSGETWDQVKQTILRRDD